jgi:gamma-glutamyltranspeptidase/glutathione hydrolase
VEALKRGFEDRARYMGDPNFLDSFPSYLADPAYAIKRARTIRSDQASLGENANNKKVILEEGSNTTHFSIVDAQGNRVAATLSLNTPFGSGFVAGKTGVLLNNEMDDFSSSGEQANVYGLTGSTANAIAPGKRPLSSMCPSFVEDERGVLVLGTPGGPRIISMVLLAIEQYAGQKEVDIQKIVAAPRYHHQYRPDEVTVEPDAFDENTLEQLRALGHAVRVSAQKWGNMQLVFIDKKTGQATAAGDPRDAVRK